MRQISAASIGMTGINVRATAGTQRVSNPIGMQNVIAATVRVTVSETDATPGTGKIKLIVRVINTADSSSWYEVDLTGDLDTSNDGVTHVVTFGPAQLVSLAGGGSAGSESAVLAVMGKIQLITEVTQQTGGTDAAANVDLGLEDRG